MRELPAPLAAQLESTRALVAAPVALVQQAPIVAVRLQGASIALQVRTKALLAWDPAVYVVLVSTRVLDLPLVPTAQLVRFKQLRANLLVQTVLRESTARAPLYVLSFLPATTNLAQEATLT